MNIERIQATAAEQGWEIHGSAPRETLTLTRGQRNIYVRLSRTGRVDYALADGFTIAAEEILTQMRQSDQETATLSQRAHASAYEAAYTWAYVPQSGGKDQLPSVEKFAEHYADRYFDTPYAKRPSFREFWQAMVDAGTIEN